MSPSDLGLAPSAHPPAKTDLVSVLGDALEASAAANADAAPEVVDAIAAFAATYIEVLIPDGRARAAFVLGNDAATDGSPAGFPSASGALAAKVEAVLASSLSCGPALLAAVPFYAGMGCVLRDVTALVRGSVFASL